MASIPTGSIFGPTLAGAMSGGSDPFKNTLQAVGDVPRALLIAQSLSTRGQKEYDRRQDVKLKRAEVAAVIAKKLGYGGSELDAIFKEFATSDTPARGTGGGGGAARPADTTSGAANVGELRRLANELNQRAQIEYRPGGVAGTWPQSREEITEGESPSHYKSISRATKSDLDLPSRYSAAEDQRAKMGDLEAALNSLTGEGGSIERAEARIKALQEKAELRKGRLGTDDSVELKALLSERQGLRSQVGVATSQLEEAMRFKPDMGLENPATRIGLPADYILDPSMVSYIGSLLKTDHPTAREALNVIGVDPSVTAEDLKGLGSEVRTYSRKLAKIYRKDLTAKREQQAELGLAGRIMTIKARLAGVRYPGDNADALAKELAKLSDAEVTQALADIETDPKFSHELALAKTRANQVTKVINEYTGLHQKGTGTPTGTGTGQPSPATTKQLQAELEDLRGEVEKYEKLQEGPDGRQLFPDEWEALILARRRVENKLQEYYAASNQRDVRFPTAMNAAQHAWDKKMNMEKATQFMKQQGFGAQASASLDAFGRHGAWNKRAAEEPAEAVVDFTTFEQWWGEQDRDKQAAFDRILRSTASSAKRTGLSKDAYLEDAKKNIEFTDDAWNAAGVKEYVAGFYDVAGEGGAERDPMIVPSDAELGGGAYQGTSQSAEDVFGDKYRPSRNVTGTDVTPERVRKRYNDMLSTYLKHYRDDETGPAIEDEISEYVADHPYEDLAEAWKDAKHLHRPQ